MPNCMEDDPPKGCIFNAKVVASFSQKCRLVARLRLHASAFCEMTPQPLVIEEQPFGGRLPCSFGIKNAFYISN